MNKLIQSGSQCYAALVGSLFFTISGSDLQAWSIVERREFNLLCGYPNYQLASMMAQASQFDWFSMGSIPVGVSPTVLHV